LRDCLENSLTGHYSLRDCLENSFTGVISCKWVNEYQRLSDWLWINENNRTIDHEGVI
jgi:hypothetical protein